MADTEIQKKDFAQTLARGLHCLEILAETSQPMTCTQVASGMGVSRAAARRVLLTLLHLGYAQEDRGYYAPSPRVLALGRGLLGKESVWGTVQPEIVRLANLFNEPCSVSILDGFEILFVCRDSTRRIYSARLSIGDKLPAYSSASGKVLLASLSPAELDERLEGVTLTPRGPASLVDAKSLKTALKEVKEQGFGMAIDEMEEGTLSIAVPIHEVSGRTVAAVSLASHASRLSREALEAKVLPELRTAASRIEGIVRDFQERKWAVF